MSNSLKLRLLTAAVLIPAVIVSVICLDTDLLALLIGTIVCLAAWEWSALIGNTRPVKRLMYMIIIIFGMFGAYVYRTDPGAAILIISSALWWLCVLAMVVISQKSDRRLLDSHLFKAVIGFIVLVPAWLSIVLLHSRGQASGYILLFLLVLIWTADTSAYFAGKRWGKTKLAHKVSPGKTWEGVYGALAATSLIVLIYAVTLGMQAIEISIFLLICLVTVLASILGDLLESMMKRSVNIKDSSGLLPGHGGVLDRIDSLTAAAPVFFTGIWLMEAGL